MLKTTFTALAFALTAGLAHAAPTTLEARETTPITQDIVQIEEFSYYCEWVTVYDYWGNWVTAWQCY